MDSPFGDLIDVELQVAVADSGSVGRAARVVGMSQPAASRRLHDIERRSKATLYVLGPRGTTLTAAGNFWTTEARSVLSMLKDAGERFSAGQWSSDSLNLYASHVVADYLLPIWLNDWRAREGKSCHIEVGNSTIVRRNVECGHVELGLLQTSRDQTSDLRELHIMSDRLIVIVSNDHPWARLEQPLPIRKFVQTPLVCRESSSLTQMLVTAAVDKLQLKLATPTLQVQSTLAVKSAVMAGIAPGLLPGIAIREDLRMGVVSAVDVEGFDIELWVSAILRPDQPLGAAAQSFLAHIMEVNRNQQGRNRTGATYPRSTSLP